jgi:hypothetical protein
MLSETVLSWYQDHVIRRLTSIEFDQFEKSAADRCSEDGVSIGSR